MSTIPTPQRFSAPALQMDLFQPETWTNAASSMSSPATFEATDNATCSLERVGGRLLHDLLGGPMTGSSGQARLPASHGALLAQEPARQTSATCLPSSAALSADADPLALWESRFRELLAEDGLTLWPAAWKQTTTPSGRPLPQLVPSGRSTAGTGYSLWPTPAARDYRAPNRPDGASRATRSPTSGKQLPNEIVCHLGGTTDSASGTTGSLGWCNPAFASWLMGYPIGWMFLAPLETPSCHNSELS